MIMASAGSNNKAELPVIWLTAPEVFVPSHHPVKDQAIPIAVSAVLASLIVLVLVIIYNWKDDKVASRDAALAELKNSIRVVRPTTSPSPFPVSHIPTRSLHSGIDFEHRTTPVTDRLSSITSTDDIPQAQDYHRYLKKSIHGSSRQSAAASSSSSRNSCIVPFYHEDGTSTSGFVDNVAAGATRAQPIETASSSVYSVPTGIYSGQGSVREEGDDGVMRLAQIETNWI